MSDIFSPVSAAVVCSECRVKYYIDSSSGILRPYELMVFNRPIFKKRGFEKIAHFSEKSESKKERRDGEEPSTDRSRQRALRQCYDYLINNGDLNLFITLTLSKEKINRYSYDEIIKKLNIWLDNRVRRKGLKYIIIPEFHKDGAIHFHGIINSGAVEMVDSGKKKRGKTIYNLDFPYGFTTAMYIDGADAGAKVANYCLKYMTKADKKVGGRYYLHGGNLNVPVERFPDVSINEVPGTAFEIFPSTECKVLRNEEEIIKIIGDVNE